MADDELTYYIVAGGPSLKGYNWNLLKRKHVIAVNRAFEKLPNAEVVYFSDDHFFDWFKEPLLAHRGRKATCSKKIDHPDVINFKMTGRQGIDTHPDCLKVGNCSTHAAINLAFHMGAKKIIILGLDMKFADDGSSHWHDGYRTANTKRALEKMMPYFQKLAIDLADHDILVLNANLDSEVDVFEKIPLEVAHRV